MPVVYVPKDTRMADAFNNALNTFVKTRMYSDDKDQKEAAYKLQTLMELGGQVSDAEIGQLEKTLRLAPGQLKSSMVTDPATGISKIPSRLERESGAALSTFERKARKEEQLKGEFAPAEAQREVQKIKTVGPAQTSQAVAQTEAVGKAQTEIDVKKQERLIKITRDSHLELLKEEDKLKRELAEQGLEADARIAKARALAGVETQILVNTEMAKKDPKLKLELEKTAAEIKKIGAEAKEAEAKGKYYEGASKAEEAASKEKIELAKIEGKDFDVKQKEIQDFLVASGLGSYDDKGKVFTPKPVAPDDPAFIQARDSLKAKGYDVNEVKVKGKIEAAKGMVSGGKWGEPDMVILSVTPGKVKRNVGEPAKEVVKDSIALTPVEEDLFKRARALPENKQYTDEQIKKAIKAKKR